MKQTMLVMAYLRKHGSISQKEATDELGITRLSARIWELRHKCGFEILDKTETSKNRFGLPCRYKRYYLP